MAVKTKRGKTAAVRPQGGLVARRDRRGIVFCIPFVITFLIFNIYPVFRTLQMSFMSYKGFGKETFIAFDNYKRAFKDTFCYNKFGLGSRAASPASIRLVPKLQ